MSAWRLASLSLLFGGCSLLANPDTIPRPDAGVCQPSCTGVACGESDGCGAVCEVGGGCDCTALCSGVNCGGSDGCGGTCQANSSSCLCTPQCTSKACGASDDCRGTCAVGSGCTCTANCSMRPCGADDGCGVACVPGTGCTAARNSLREFRVEVLSSHPLAPVDDGGFPDGDGGVLPAATHEAVLHSGAAGATDIAGSNYRLERLEVSP